jgi:hypothetical protein
MYSYNRIMFSSTHKTSVVGSTFANKRQSNHVIPPLQSIRILEQVQDRVRDLNCSMFVDTP